MAYLVENMMEEVLRSGTGAGVHARGFNLPAAGKTGTSRDGWFAGFTSKLICVVWVGFDDNRDFKLEGARSALPIWTEFMKRAHQHREYRNVHEFEAPDGIVTAEIDADTGQLATPAAPKSPERGVHRRNAAGGSLPAAWRRANAGGRLGTLDAYACIPSSRSADHTESGEITRGGVYPTECRPQTGAEHPDCAGPACPTREEGPA